ncbi:hypothetical protein PUNSTDRAFT_49740 [Punctularia strigosozonata HHB-11173 SS5]|uniref:uncharacterized protein n=1 Tax=Punctularia strigosozonata (strain HHB-11173) TaxID=741275 RepID=UPI0004416E54|nr:uncharacterized protein PUNSTDRAFT_49740 [Punctularia strigosozonata HHB-11173 SS5]EIN12434.1 hypothetical protein PUNSTDRAFT_49740 [Punctularia strigosozonata HHB-11173 SS5]
MSPVGSTVLVAVLLSASFLILLIVTVVGIRYRSYFAEPQPGLVRTAPISLDIARGDPPLPPPYETAGAPPAYPYELDAKIDLPVPPVPAAMSGAGNDDILRNAVDRMRPWRTMDTGPRCMV